MKNKIVSGPDYTGLYQYQDIAIPEIKKYHVITPAVSKQPPNRLHTTELAEILFITSYPPRECGIATYSQDLIKALENKFSNCLSIKVCALETGDVSYTYPGEVKFVLNTSVVAEYEILANKINKDDKIKIVLIQHEFGFYHQQEQAFLQFLLMIEVPVAIVFHTVLPRPDEKLKLKIRNIAAVCSSIVVMTNTSAKILVNDYCLPEENITVIAHGTHLVLHLDEKFLKKKYGFEGRKVLTTFGLLSSGKSIETTLDALPAIVKTNPEVLFLIIGKTHPEVVKSEGEKYREMLMLKVEKNNLQDHVRFVNSYLPLPILLEYLQLTDIYLFTTNDPNQAVSGTFVYAMSCACPIISTPIPHALEVLTKDTGIIFDFHNSQQLTDSILRLLNDEALRRNLASNTLQKIVSTAWENSAVDHAMLFGDISEGKIILEYNLPAINLSHMVKMTTDIGIIQFSKINQPDIDSGYTLDDNARALIALCMHYKITGDENDISYIRKYVHFIEFCMQPGGNFLNYVDKKRKFTGQNTTTNLDDANGRAVWALGYLISLSALLPADIIAVADATMKKSITRIRDVHSPRAMAFAIKGLFYYQNSRRSFDVLILIKIFADRLVQMFKHESDSEWKWYESYLTYANSILPEAVLCAYILTRNETYRDVAVSSLGFLLSQIFNKNGIEVISNKKWLQKGEKAGHFGEQPIDVSYTVMTLSKFYDEFSDQHYRSKMVTAFNWFLGKNRLQQIIYNPCTGGCYDGLEETHVNLNQGAESTVSYLMARLTIEKYTHHTKIQAD